MLIKKKNEELTDQLAVFKERQSPRWGAPQADLDIGIKITGYEGEGQVGNLSISGCSLKSVTYVNMAPDQIYQAKILPGRDDKMEPFNIKLKLNWTKSSETIFIAGFSLEGSDGKEQLKNYVELLRSRGIAPDYGNMKPENQN